MTLSEYQIKTKNVYLNIIEGDKIHTKTLSTEEATKKYGNHTVVEFQEPEPETECIEGVTNIVVIAQL